jgi:hypothetical protein
MQNGSCERFGYDAFIYTECNEGLGKIRECFFACSFQKNVWKSLAARGHVLGKCGVTHGSIGAEGFGHRATGAKIATEYFSH